MANTKLITTQALIAKFEYALDNGWGYIWGTAGILWTAAKQQAKVNYMISKYGKNWKTSAEAKKDTYYPAAYYGDKWIGHEVADCSGLFVWAFKALGGSIYHGSNTIWNSYCTAKGELKNGKRTDGQDLKPGTAIFTHKVEKDKNGKVISDKRGHIGLYIGDGWVIEASGTINGVIKSKITISKWVEWGELKGVDYGTAAPDVISDPEENPRIGTLRKGDKGPAVKYIQKLLIGAGYKLPRYGADGDYGNETVSAVKAFQKDHNLTADGILGPKTLAALEAADKPLIYYTVTIEHLSAPEAEALVAKYKTATMAEKG